MTMILAAHEENTEAENRCSGEMSSSDGSTANTLLLISGEPKTGAIVPTPEAQRLSIGGSQRGRTFAGLGRVHRPPRSNAPADTAT